MVLHSRICIYITLHCVCAPLVACVHACVCAGGVAAHPKGPERSEAGCGNPANSHYGISVGAQTGYLPSKASCASPFILALCHLISIHPDKRTDHAADRHPHP